MESKAVNSSSHSTAILQNTLFSGVSPFLIAKKNLSHGRLEFGFSPSTALYLQCFTLAIVPTKQAHSPSYCDPSTRPLVKASRNPWTSFLAVKRTAPKSFLTVDRLASDRLAFDRDILADMQCSTASFIDGNSPPNIRFPFLFLFQFSFVILSGYGRDNTTVIPQATITTTANVVTMAIMPMARLNCLSVIGFLFICALRLRPLPAVIPRPRGRGPVEACPIDTRLIMSEFVFLIIY